MTKNVIFNTGKRLRFSTSCSFRYAAHILSTDKKTHNFCIFVHVHAMLLIKEAPEHLPCQYHSLVRALDFTQTRSAVIIPILCVFWMGIY